MRVETFSYRFAEEILQHEKFRDAYNEIIAICDSCPVPTYKGKSPRRPKLDVLQQVMNTYLRLAFEDNGWESEPFVSPVEYADGLRADFRKTFDANDVRITLQLEVEFGNVASSYRNYFKFQLSFANNLCDVAVLIVPSQHLCCRIDGGVSNYEKVVRELPSARLSTTVPILVIGLFDLDENGNPIDEWDVKAEGVSLDVAKGASAQFEKQHLALVRPRYRADSNLNDDATKMFASTF